MNLSPLLRCSVVCTVTALLATGCPPAPTPPGSGNAAGLPSPQGTFDPFFVGGDASGKSLEGGAAAELPGGGTLTLPKGSPSGVELGIVQGSLTQEARDAFGDDFPDTVLAGDILQITARVTGDTPAYVVLRLPASDSSSRIFLAGYVDADTSRLDWEPLATQFDAAAGVVTALVGWEQLGPVALANEAAAKGASVSSDATPLVYTGHVVVVIGGQSFQSDVVFVATEPTTSLSVPLGGPPIPMRARIGLKLSNITTQPLESLTVTSNFGPRGRPVQGASTNHKGVDYRATDGTNVLAAGDGKVITSRCALESVNCGPKANGDISAGYIVEILHADGEVTRYLHLTNPAIVPVGVAVDAGEVIAFSGSTGGVAPHLHFEVRKNGVAVDPQKIFNSQATATLAVAVDNQIEFGTQQEIPITHGIITLENMAEYVTVAELTGVDAGQHKLQFVLVQPQGRLAILAEVPLTVLPAGDFSGSEENLSDITWTPESGLIDHQYTRFTSQFTLTAVDDQNAEGQAHLTFETKGTTTYSNVDECPIESYSSGLVEWDTPVTGTFTLQEDGTLSLQVFALNETGPPILVTYTRPGCTPPAPAASSGYIWNGVGGILTGGFADRHDDYPLGTDESGEHYYEVHLRKTNHD